MFRAGRMSLFWRIFITNAIVLVAAGVGLAVSPATVSAPISTTEVEVLVGGLVLMLVVNLVVMRRVFSPLARLTALMKQVDPMQPGRRVPITGGGAEVAQVGRAFNAMLDRIERERRDSARRALAAQENERQRIAQELHDEVGQTLTAVLLRLDRVAMTAGDEIGEELEDAERFVRESLEDVRGIAQRLRPEALDDLGLAAALAGLAERIRESSELSVSVEIEGPPGRLDEVGELVIYRVTQEALTNVVRHAEARSVVVRLDCRGSEARLEITDDGRGMAGANGDGSGGSGIAGMRERALLVGGELAIGPAPGGGCRVRLLVPLTEVEA